MTKRITNESRQAQLQKILQGIAKRYPAGTTIPLGGVTYAPADLTKLIQSDLDAMVASATAKATYSTQVELERIARTKVSPVLRQLKNYVLTTLGDTQDAAAALADFGYSPRKVTEPTVKTKAEAQVKAQATRKAKEPASQSTQAANPPAATSTPAGTTRANG